MSSYKHLFFDLDHTLWDFEANSGITLRHLYETFDLKKKGIEDFEVFRVTYEMHNDRMWELFRNGKVQRDILKWKRMWLTLLDFKMPDRELANEMSAIYLALLPNQGQLMEGTIPLLEFCKANDYILHIITNGFEDTQQKKMITSGLVPYFDQIITSENSNSMKPKSEIFTYSFDKAKALKKDSLMIGDNLEADILGAKNFGFDQVWFNPQKLDHQGVDPTYQVNNISEIKEILI